MAADTQAAEAIETAAEHAAAIVEAAQEQAEDAIEAAAEQVQQAEEAARQLAAAAVEGERGRMIADLQEKYSQWRNDLDNLTTTTGLELATIKQTLSEMSMALAELVSKASQPVTPLILVPSEQVQTPAEEAPMVSAEAMLPVNPEDQTVNDAVAVLEVPAIAVPKKLRRLI